MRIFSTKLIFLHVYCCIYYSAVVNRSGQQRVPINHDNSIINETLITIERMKSRNRCILTCIVLFSSFRLG